MFNFCFHSISPITLEKKRFVFPVSSSNKDNLKFLTTYLKSVFYNIKLEYMTISGGRYLNTFDEQVNQFLNYSNTERHTLLICTVGSPYWS